jgi:hypothetical protein
MVKVDSPQPRRPEDIMAVLTRRGAVVWSRRRRRVTLARPCTIDPRGVTLYRWPLRSVFVPLERVDRFDVALEQREMPGEERERLVLLTREGTTIPVQKTQWSNGWRGLPLRSTARLLNNHIMPTWRSGPDDDERAES